jgi:hypothetical protein
MMRLPVQSSRCGPGKSAPGDFAKLIIISFCLFVEVGGEPNSGASYAMSEDATEADARGVASTKVAPLTTRRPASRPVGRTHRRHPKERRLTSSTTRRTRPPTDSTSTRYSQCSARDRDFHCPTVRLGRCRRVGPRGEMRVEDSTSRRRSPAIRFEELSPWQDDDPPA